MVWGSMKRKKIICSLVVAGLIICFLTKLWFFNKRLDFEDICNLYKYHELVTRYEELDLSFWDDGPYPYLFSVIKNDDGDVEELQIEIRNINYIDHRQICEIVNVTEEYMVQQDGFPYKVTIDIEDNGSLPGYAEAYNYNMNTGELLSEGTDWVLTRFMYINVSSFEELCERYSMFVGFDLFCVNDASDYEILADWEGLIMLHAYSNNTPEEIELYNEALREMFPDGSVYIQTR